MTTSVGGALFEPISFLHINLYVILLILNASRGEVYRPCQ